MIYSPVRTPPIPATHPPFPSARPPVFVSIIRTCYKTSIAAWHPPKFSASHSIASHCDALNFGGGYALLYQVCKMAVVPTPLFGTGILRAGGHISHPNGGTRSSQVGGPAAALDSIGPFCRLPALARRYGASCVGRSIRSSSLQRPRTTSLSITVIPSNCCRVIVYS